MRTLANLFVIASLAPCQLTSAPAAAQEPYEVLARRLVPATVFASEADPYLSMEEQMAANDVPGIAVAVIEDGEIAWSHAWGVVDTRTREPLTAGTRFQAASLSKPIAGAAFVDLAEDGLIRLDADVGDYVQGWSVNAAPPIRPEEILSHSGGLTVSGFPGYAQGDEVPSLLQILQGQPPANTEAVVYDPKTRGKFSYSGGGFVALQSAMESVAGMSFADLVRERVFEPAGMTSSNFESPPPGAAGYAVGHYGRDEPIDGGWHIYPEQAAAGMWTTVEDLARFALNITGHSTTGIDILGPAAAADYQREHIPETALGIWIMEADGHRALYHTGGNAGFHTNFFTFDDGSHGVFVLTNNDVSTRLIYQTIRAVSRMYEWPAFHKPRVIQNIEFDEGLTAALPGTYAVRGSPQVVHIAWDGEAMVLTPPGSDEPRRFFLVEESLLVSREGTRLRYRAEPHGSIREIGIGPNDEEMLRFTRR